MRYRRLGRSGLQVSEICMGTMTFGTQNDEAQTHAQLDYAFDRGVAFIDTAERYSVPPTAQSYGRSEGVVGTWLKKRRRDEVIVATKVSGPARAITRIRGGPLALDCETPRVCVLRPTNLA